MPVCAKMGVPTPLASTHHLNTEPASVLSLVASSDGNALPGANTTTTTNADPANEALFGHQQEGVKDILVVVLTPSMLAADTSRLPANAGVTQMKHSCPAPRARTLGFRAGGTDEPQVTGTESVVVRIGSHSVWAPLNAGSRAGTLLFAISSGPSCPPGLRMRGLRVEGESVLGESHGLLEPLCP